MTQPRLLGAAEGGAAGGGWVGVGWGLLAGASPADAPRPPRRKCERTQCHDFLECQNAPARITHYLLNFQL